MFRDELYQLIKDRRSIRSWNDIDIPDHIVDKIIEAGVYAPSACSCQKVKFQLIKDKTMIEQISRNTSDWFQKTFPNKIIVTYFDLSVRDAHAINYGTPHKFWSRFIWQDSSAAMQNMILMAEALDVSSCWVSHRPDREGLHEGLIKLMLQIPDHMILTSFLFLGYSEVKPNYETDYHQGNPIKRDMSGSRLKDI